jgi:hypothetical protein
MERVAGFRELLGARLQSRKRNGSFGRFLSRVPHSPKTGFNGTGVGRRHKDYVKAQQEERKKEVVIRRDVSS